MNTVSSRFYARVNTDAFFRRETHILLFRRIIDQGVESLAVAQPVSFIAYDEAKDILPSYPAPTFSLPTDAAQELIDELWRAGLRPTEGSGSSGQLAAISRHLEDMRALVFKTEKPPAPAPS